MRTKAEFSRINGYWCDFEDGHPEPGEMVYAKSYVCRPLQGERIVIADDWVKAQKEMGLSSWRVMKC